MTTTGKSPQRTDDTAPQPKAGFWAGFNAKGFMRAWLSNAILATFVFALTTLLGRDDANDEILYFMMGQLSALVMVAFQFYFGTSQSSAQKNEMIDYQLRLPHYREEDCVDDFGRSRLRDIDRDIERFRDRGGRPQDPTGGM